MTNAPPTRAVANLHLHLEYDSGLDVIAAAMASIPEGDEGSDEHRGHVAGDISSAVAHLLDIYAIAPEGSLVRITEVAVEVSVDIDEHVHDLPVLESRTDGEFAELEGEARELFGKLELTEDEFELLDQASVVSVSAGPPPFELAPALTDVPRFIADWGIVCGYLARACEFSIDCVFDDFELLRSPILVGAPVPTGVASSLPEQWEHEYTLSFHRRFLVTLADVTTQVTRGWDGPANIAQALAMSYLVGSIEMLLELDGAAVRGGMLETLRERLVDDELIAAVYDGSDPALGFEYWFVPFDEEEATAPYATDLL